MSRPTQVWCADQRQTGPFVAAAGCIVSLPGGKQTDRKCLECSVTYQLNREERGFQIPTAAGGHDYIQQTGAWRSRLSQPFKRTRPSCAPPPPLYLIPLGVPVGEGRNKIKLRECFFIVWLKPGFFFRYITLLSYQKMCFQPVCPEQADSFRRALLLLLSRDFSQCVIHSQNEKRDAKRGQVRTAFKAPKA